MTQWSRAELAAAFEHYQETVRRAADSGDWSLFSDLFVEDADYNEHAYGRFTGRAAIRDWIIQTMTTFPGSSMVAFPISWSVIDEDRGWIVCEVQNVMADPGDGSLHQEPNITILRYAGDNLFAAEEDVYNPGRYLPMVQNWARVAESHGRLPDEGRQWLERISPARSA